MKPIESVVKFKEFAAVSGVSILECTPREGFEQFFSFHDNIKAEGCEDQGSDTLLFQWGVYDWAKGKFFELNIARQFVEDGLEGDDAISQLNFTFNYAPTAALAEIEAGNAWSDGPINCATFPEFVFSSKAFLAVLGLVPRHIELAHWYV